MHIEVKELAGVKLVCLPANTTSKLQPLDQGVFKNFKVLFRRHLLQRVLLCMDCGKDNDVMLLSAIGFIQAAWDQVQPKTIANCFRHCGFKCVDLAPTENAKNESVIEVHNPCHENSWWDKETFEDYVAVDDNVEVCGSLNEDEIVKIVCADEQNSDDSEPETEKDVVRPSNQAVDDAIECLRNFIHCGDACFSNQAVDDAIECLRNFIHCGDACFVELHCLMKIEDLVFRSRASKRKQMKITNYFK